MNTQIEALMIARPSRFPDSLHLLLASMSLIENIHLADDIESALKVTAVPAVVVVDAEVDGSCLSAAINKIKAAWPQAKLITLVEDELEFQTAQSAESGAVIRPCRATGCVSLLQ